MRRQKNGLKVEAEEYTPHPESIANSEDGLDPRSAIYSESCPVEG